MRVAYTSEKSHIKYKENVPYWRTAILSVLAKHNLIPRCHIFEIHAFSAGLNPVFCIDQQWVIKFYSKLFSSQEIYKKEKDVLATLQRVVVPQGFHMELPAVSFSGHLYDRFEDPWLFEDPRRWHWPYTIQKCVSGHSYRELYAGLNGKGHKRVAQYLGQALSFVHSTPFESKTFSTQDPWDPFHSFLQARYREVVVKFKDNKLLPNHFLRDLSVYLPQHVEDLYDDVKVNPCLLHGDMTDDHLLGKLTKKGWKPSGLIDFGDATVGDRLYELVPILIDFFRCESDPVVELMKSYGLSVWVRQNFAYKAMCYTLLHAQDAFRTVWKYKPEWKQCQSLKELENVMWGFGDRLSHHFQEFPIIPSLPISPSLPIMGPGPVPGSFIPVPPGGIQEFPSGPDGTIPNTYYDPSQSPVPVPGFHFPVSNTYLPADFGTSVAPDESPVPPSANPEGMIASPVPPSALLSTVSASPDTESPVPPSANPIGTPAPIETESPVPTPQPVENGSN